jgi:hypothetical protein
LVQELGATPNRCTYSVHLSAFSKSLKKLYQSHLELGQGQEVLGELVLSQKEHLATSLTWEGPVRWEEAHLPSTQRLMMISGTMGTMYHGLE